MLIERVPKSAGIILYYIPYMYVYQVELIPEFFISIIHSKISNNSRLVKWFNTFAFPHTLTFFNIFFLLCFFFVFFMFFHVFQCVGKPWQQFSRSKCVYWGGRDQFAFENDVNDNNNNRKIAKNSSWFHNYLYFVYYIFPPLS